MSRTLARRGASILTAMALLGGGLALGAGTASAAEATGAGSGDTASLGVVEQVWGSVGMVPEWGSFLVLLVGTSTGSIDDSNVVLGCAAIENNGCPDPMPTSTQQLLAILAGHGNGPYPALPWAPAIP